MTVANLSHKWRSGKKWFVITLLTSIAALVGTAQTNAQSTGSYVNVCSSYALDGSYNNYVDETVCLYGDATGLDSYAELDLEWYQQNIYIVEVGLEAQLYGPSGLISDSGEQQGSNPSVNDWIPSPQIGAWYTLESQYDECHDPSADGNPCYGNWTGLMSGLSVMAMVTGLPTPTLTLSSSNALPSLGQNVTFSASISNGVNGVITFSDGGTSIGTGTISGGVASLTISNLSARRHSIVASWPGSGSFNATTSAPLNQVVAAPAYSVSPPSGPTSLSANAGLNPQDTYLIMDMSSQSGGTINNVAINDAVRTTHVELGYDTGGSPVLNSFPQNTGLDPTTSRMIPLSATRFSGGGLTSFATDNNSISPTRPTSSVPSGWPSTIPAIPSGTSVVGGFVIPNITTFAQKQGVTAIVTGNTATITRTGADGIPVVFQYTQQASGWILSGVSASGQDSSGTWNRQVTLNNITYSRNSAFDANRVGNQLPYHPHTATNATPNLTPSSSSSYAPGTYLFNNYGGTQNVLFQHGFKSSGKTWERMTGWLNQDFVFGDVMVPSLDATAPLADQSSQLRTLISQAGGNNYILIGHSQGGLISRSISQYYQSQSQNTVQGVITVDTPHQGAAITATLPSAIGNLGSVGRDLFGWMGCIGPFDNPGCYSAALIAGGGAIVAQDLLDSVGALNDLTPGSSFLTTLNAQPENFQRAAIIGATDQRWLLERVADTAITSNNPDDAFGERTAAEITELAYDVIGVDFLFHLGDEANWAIYCFVEGGYEDGDPSCWEDPDLPYLSFDLHILTALDKVDDFYDHLIAPDGYGSDGFVQNTSQVYPGSGVTQLVIYDSDTHVSATKSPNDRAALDYLLSSTYKVAIPTPVSQCTYATTPTSVSIPASGGTFYISLSTQTGCQWSAASQLGWVSIDPSSISGTNSALVTIEVQPVTQGVSRSGTITIGNGYVAASVFINQAATCTYDLSPSPTIDFTSAGGTTTVQVTTQVGCAWSATSSQTWLTIANGSGNGTGTFTITAAPNAPSSANPAVINVMGQTITVSENGNHVHCMTVPVCTGGTPPPFY